MLKPLDHLNLAGIALCWNPVHMSGLKRLIVLRVPWNKRVVILHGIKHMVKPLLFDPLQVNFVKAVSPLVENVNPIDVGMIDEEWGALSEVGGYYEGEMGVWDDSLETASRHGHHVKIAVLGWTKAEKPLHQTSSFTSTQSGWTWVSDAFLDMNVMFSLELSENRTCPSLRL